MLQIKDWIAYKIKVICFFLACYKKKDTERLKVKKWYSIKTLTEKKNLKAKVAKLVSGQIKFKTCILDIKITLSNKCFSQPGIFDIFEFINT